MKKHIVKVLKTDFLNPGVKRFVVKKPAGYVFIPGQATAIAINEPKLLNQSRLFTFTSVSQADHLEFIVKIYSERNGVTKELLGVKTGDELVVHEPFGTIRYQGPGLFIAGGMGITPIYRYFPPT
jgi:ferredoxin-NADP reductase